MTHPDPRTYDWVLAAPFRAHLHCLKAASGLPWTVIALAAGVSPSLVRGLIDGRDGRRLRRIPPRDAARLLRLDAAGLRALATHRVPAAPTLERVRFLLTQGHDLATVAAWCRSTPGQLRALPRAQRCNALTALFAEAACLAQERALVATLPLAPAA